jgi:hypothetical protein
MNNNKDKSIALNLSKKRWVFFLVFFCTTAFLPPGSSTANPVPDNPIIKFTFFSHGLPSDSPVDIQFFCPSVFDPVFSRQCTTECQVVLRSGFSAETCYLFVKPEGQNGFVLDGFFITYFQPNLSHYLHEVSIDIDDGSCSYAANPYLGALSVHGCEPGVLTNRARSNFPRAGFLIAMAISIEFLSGAFLISVVFRLNSIPIKDFALTVIIMNLLTIPGFWSAFGILLSAFPEGYYPLLVFLEAVVVAIEAACYWKLRPLSFSQALAISTIANICSAVFGLLYQA